MIGPGSDKNKTLMKNKMKKKQDIDEKTRRRKNKTSMKKQEEEKTNLCCHGLAGIVMNLDRLKDSSDFIMISDILRTISGFFRMF